MRALPLPPALRPHLDLEALDPGSEGNRSLLFHRGFARYDRGWSIPTEGEQEFLQAFRDRFARAPEDYERFVPRRTQALEAAGARALPLLTQSPLVIGLGLPHPTETALLLDRLTGCPYLPGSSVKGLLRAAARLAAVGELPMAEAGDRAFWQEHLDRLFGPELGGEAVPARGELVVYDAFPDRWPALELDVLTPHYQPYYGDDGAGAEEEAEVPADWHDPNPVTFLTVAPGTRFTFWLGHGKAEGAEGDLKAAEGLLGSALDWLGLGGKTSGGYGRFGAEPPARPMEVPLVPPEEDESPPPPLPPGQVRWEGAELLLLRSLPNVKGPNGETAQGFHDDVDPAVLNSLRQGAVLRVDAVVKKLGGGWSLVKVERVRD